MLCGAGGTSHRHKHAPTHPCPNMIGERERERERERDRVAPAIPPEPRLGSGRRSGLRQTGAQEWDVQRWEGEKETRERGWGEKRSQELEDREERKRQRRSEGESKREKERECQGVLGIKVLLLVRHKLNRVKGSSLGTGWMPSWKKTPFSALLLFPLGECGANA